DEIVGDALEERCLVRARVRNQLDAAALELGVVGGDRRRWRAELQNHLGDCRTRITLAIEQPLAVRLGVIGVDEVTAYLHRNLIVRPAPIPDGNRGLDGLEV